MDEFKDIINAWPDLDALAADTGASKEAVKKWHRRNTIPAEYWALLIEAASLRRIEGVTAELLTDLARRQAA